MTTDWDPDRALYGISVAAKLTGINPQMLRVYESRKQADLSGTSLCDPSRTQPFGSLDGLPKEVDLASPE
jgi:hypothetical protein